MDAKNVNQQRARYARREKAGVLFFRGVFKQSARARALFHGAVLSARGVAARRALFRLEMLFEKPRYCCCCR